MKYLGENNINLFLNFLKETNHKMRPCSKNDLIKLRQIANEKELPASYMSFMKDAGNGIRFFKGSSYNMSEIFNLQEWAIELLDEDGSDEMLTDNDFVFFMHQGYQFYFFKLNEGNDPPVYFYEEGENSKSFIKKYKSFTDFIIKYYNEVESLIKE